jgi:hypothetical protein
MYKRATHHILDERSRLGVKISASKRDRDPSATVIDLADLPPLRKGGSTSDRLVDEDSTEVAKYLDHSIVLFDPWELAVLLLLLDDLREDVKAVRCRFIDGPLPSALGPELGGAFSFGELGSDIVVQRGEVGGGDGSGASNSVGEGVVGHSGGLEAGEGVGVGVEGAEALLLVAL